MNDNTDWTGIEPPSETEVPKWVEKGAGILAFIVLALGVAVLIAFAAIAVIGAISWVFG